MTIFNILVVVGIIIILLVFAGWYTISKFDDIESGKSDRRDHVENDVQVDDRKTEQ